MWQYQNLPYPTLLTFSRNKILPSKLFVISFPQLVFSHESGTIYVDISLFFSQLEDKQHSVFYF